MAIQDASLEEVVRRLPHLTMRKHELPCPPNVVYRIVEGFRARYAERDPDCADGVRVAWPDAWLHVRASNTEPLLRVIVEAETAQRAASLLDETLETARAGMGKA